MLVVICMVSDSVQHVNFNVDHSQLFPETKTKTKETKYKHILKQAEQKSTQGRKKCFNTELKLLRGQPTKKSNLDAWQK